MKSSNHKLLNDAYTLHLIITILLALGGFVTGIAYAIIQENGWLLLAIWLGTFVVVVWATFWDGCFWTCWTTLRR